MDEFKDPPRLLNFEDKMTFTPPKFILKFWNGFRNAIILAILFTMVGTTVGVKVAKDYYTDRMDEIIQTGAMLHKTKVYNVTLKL
jgi:hypothetical protein